MAEPLKNIYNDAFFAEFASAVKTVVPGLQIKKFIATVKSNQWQQMELKQRMRQLATAMHNVLTGSYKNKLQDVLKIMNALPKKSAVQYGGLAYMLIPDFVEQYGLLYPDLSLKAMEHITQFTSCEFAIRPYLLQYPEKVMQQMLQWSQHKNENVRRFSCEGCRPRLPWAMAIPALKKDPSLILPILENLKNDSSEFVRRSVANNLNDISKDNPELVIKIVTGWKNRDTNTDWIIRHACRGLLKKANNEVLELFGTGSNTKCTVLNLSISKKKIALGEQVLFSFALKLIQKKPAKLRVEYAVYFIKANGKQSKKIFKITENLFIPGAVVNYTKKHSFKDLTTRKHYAGKHVVSIIVNGKEYNCVQLELY